MSNMNLQHDEMVMEEEVKVSKTPKEKSTLTGIAGLDIDLVVTTKVGKELRQEIKNTVVTKEELRSIIDRYYQTQDKRIVLENQIRAIKQGKDSASEFDPVNPLTCSILEWDLNQEKEKEASYKTILDKMTDNNTVTKWIKSITGIGPIFAAALYAYLDVTKCSYASGFHQYAGLNDNNRPWISSAKAKEIVDAVIGSGDITDDGLIEIAAMTGWKVDYLKKRCYTMDEEGNITGTSKKNLQNAICMPPYNKNLKTIMWNIGESFVKVQNRGSLYGRLYAERKAYETAKNERGEYAEQAARELASKNYSKSTDAYAAYVEGKLPKGHINARAKRWAVKLFLSHVFEEMYREEYHKLPPMYYALEHMDHHDYIGPEVQYTWGPEIPPTFTKEEVMQYK